MPHVLLADNDGAVSALLAEVLTRAGLVVEHAYDGEQAKAKVRAPGWGVLVCDLDMPRASGIEVLESMRDLPVVPPAIVISGYLDESISRRLGRLPWVRDVLKKPFDLMEFVRRVQELVASGAPAAATTCVF